MDTSFLIHSLLKNQVSNTLLFILTVLDQIVDDRPRAFIPGPERLSLVAGQSVELTCSSQGIPDPRVRWRRPGNQPLPPGHSVRNGVLHIPRVDPEYAGEYICSVVSESIDTDFSASVYIIVTGKTT